ncbi:MAG TPA: PEP-CTERM sorting domain-containing protein, partial [Verrucomicrobiae bacterium]|nr:PEP-CTERM sorting domain-containing protein [Verrucomicrobiae bacterium]
GFSSGTWDFRLDWGDTANQTTINDPSGNDLNATINYAHPPGSTINAFSTGAGTLTVVPEPSQYAAVAALGCLGWAFVSRKVKSAKLAA